MHGDYKRFAKAIDALPWYKRIAFYSGMILFLLIAVPLMFLGEKNRKEGK